MDQNFNIEQEQKNEFPLSTGALYALGVIFVLFIISIIGIYIYYPVEKARSIKIPKLRQTRLGRHLLI
jgi:hypothetical protein